MRFSTLLHIVGTLATAAVPALAAAAPVRAASALPAPASIGAPISAQPTPRAPSATQRSSALVGFPILAFVGLFSAVTLVVVAVSSPRRSPG